MVYARKIVLGTMRMHESSVNPSGWAKFLLAAHERGVRCLHSSTEYDSFHLFCETLAIIQRDHPGIQFRHIVKLAAPSFDDAGFDCGDLLAKIEAYRIALNVPVVHDIQWMWRKDLKVEADRLVAATEAAHAIAEAREAVTARGMAERVLCFPYTTGFADLAIKHKFCDGLIVYRNDEERDFETQLDLCAERGLPAIIIRPFLAGKLLDGQGSSARQLLARSLDHPAIESAILSTGNLAHLDALIG
jgi:hypothetical protein